MGRHAVVVGLIGLALVWAPASSRAESEWNVYLFGVPAAELEAAATARKGVARPQVADDTAILTVTLDRAAYAVLVGEGKLPYRVGNQSLQLPIADPGEHTLVVQSQHPNLVDAFNGASAAVLRVGVGADDEDPPYVTHLAVLADGERVAHLVSPGGVVELTAFDDGSGIASVTAWSTVFGFQQALPVQDEGQGHYRIVVSDHLLAYQTADLVLRLEDSEGNSLEQWLLLPVVPGPAEPPHANQ